LAERKSESTKDLESSTHVLYRQFRVAHQELEIEVRYYSWRIRGIKYLMIAKIKNKNAERADNPLCGYEQVGIMGVKKVGKRNHSSWPPIKVPVDWKVHEQTLDLSKMDKNCAAAETCPNRGLKHMVSQ